MRGMKWTGLIAVAAATALVASGCGDLPTDEAGPTDREPPTQAEPETESMGSAAEAGGICELLDFATLSEATGDNFSVASAGGEGEVTSCVIMTTKGSFPDITLTKAKTATDADTYRSEIPPGDAEDVDDLGNAAYSALREEIDGSGPIVEIGWLTDGHMYSLRYTSAEGTEEDLVRGAVDPLVAVARAADRLSAAEAEDD